MKNKRVCAYVDKDFYRQLILEKRRFQRKNNLSSLKTVKFTSIVAKKNPFKNLFDKNAKKRIFG